MNRDIQ